LNDLEKLTPNVMNHVELSDLGEKSGHSIVSSVVDATGPVVAPFDHCSGLIRWKSQVKIHSENIHNSLLP